MENAFVLIQRFMDSVDLVQSECVFKMIRRDNEKSGKMKIKINVHTQKALMKFHATECPMHFL